MEWMDVTWKITTNQIIIELCSIKVNPSFVINNMKGLGKDKSQTTERYYKKKCDKEPLTKYKKSLTFSYMKNILCICFYVYMIYMYIYVYNYERRRLSTWELERCGLTIFLIFITYFEIIILLYHSSFLFLFSFIEKRLL